MLLRPMLHVRDVPASSRWYQDAIGLRSGHGGDEYEMLFAGDAFVLQLHRSDTHSHGMSAPADGERVGLGVSLWFEVPDLDASAATARAAGATLVAEPHWNPVAHHHEATLVDPDGYTVVLHTAFEPEG